MNGTKLRIPAKAENVLAIRLFVSGLATRRGYSIQRIDDIKTAISESCVLLLSSSVGGELYLSVEEDDDMLITLSKAGTAYSAPSEDYMPEFSKILLEALADEVRITEVDGDCIAVKLIFH